MEVQVIKAMKEITYNIRVMTEEDYEQVYALWMGIHGFGIRSIDDSKEGVSRFLKRNPTTSMVADMTDEEDVCIMCACMRIIASTESARRWR